MKRNRPSRRRIRRSEWASALAVVALAFAVFLGLSPGGLPFLAHPTPTAVPTVAATPTATTSPTRLPPTSTPTLSPTPSPAPTATPTHNPTPTSGPFDSYSNTSVSWYYFRPSTTYADLPVTTGSGLKKAADKFHVIWQVPTESKVVYLTFDEGYEYANDTQFILATLKAKGVQAAFFVTGPYVRDNPKNVQDMVADGFIVGSHTWTHPAIPDLIATQGFDGLKSEMQRTEQIFKSTTGQDLSKFMRPPMGKFSDRSLAMLATLGYRTVCWSFAYQDWITTAQPDPAAAKDMILGELHPGSVILLHAVSVTNTTILSDLIDAIKARGYTFGRLDQIP